MLFCAEQGFVGAFSERVLDVGGSALASADLFLIGARGKSIAAERSIKAVWDSPMPVQSRAIPNLSDRLCGALYRRIATGRIGRLEALFSRVRGGGVITVERRRLFPLDLSSAPAGWETVPPLRNLQPEALLASLTADYIFVQLCTAALHAFVAENEARMEAMVSARGQVDRQLAALQADQRVVRQAEITAEIVELAPSAEASA